MYAFKGLVVLLVPDTVKSMCFILINHHMVIGHLIPIKYFVIYENVTLMCVLNVDEHS